MKNDRHAVGIAFAVTMSGLPSPFTSITAMDLGPFPAKERCWDWKLPLPFPDHAMSTTNEPRRMSLRQAPAFTSRVQGSQHLSLTTARPH